MKQSIVVGGSIHAAWMALAAVVILGCEDDLDQANGATGTAGNAGASGGGSGENGSGNDGVGGDSGGEAGGGGSANGEAGTGGANDNGNDGSAGNDGAASCIAAQLLWFDDFETGDYSRWTSSEYGSLDAEGCRESGFSTERAVVGEQSHRTAIGCTADSNHRVYGGIQFDGDTVLDGFTNQGTGVDAPHGIINSFWTWLDAPGFGGGRWYSFFTVTDSCSWQGSPVLTFGLEDASNRVTPAHVLNTGGSVDWADGAPSYPFRQWVRMTVYLNYHDGVMHLWQDGDSVFHATFSRSGTAMCHFHWGLYAEPSNDDITLFEDDMRLWKLEEPWTDFDVEPLLDVDHPVCD